LPLLFLLIFSLMGVYRESNCYCLIGVACRCASVNLPHFTAQLIIWRNLKRLKYPFKPALHSSCLRICLYFIWLFASFLTTLWIVFLMAMYFSYR
jgi:hypothetical protein